MQRVQRLQIVQTHGSDIEARLLMTPSSVARSLNRQGVKGKPGGKWQGNAITRTIENTFTKNGEIRIPCQLGFKAMACCLTTLEILVMLTKMYNSLKIILLH